MRAHRDDATIVRRDPRDRLVLHGTGGFAPRHAEDRTVAAPGDVEPDGLHRGQRRVVVDSNRVLDPSLVLAVAMVHHHPRHLPAVTGTDRITVTRWQLQFLVFLAVSVEALAGEVGAESVVPLARNGTPSHGPRHEPALSRSGDNEDHGQGNSDTR